MKVTHRMKPGKVIKKSLKFISVDVLEIVTERPAEYPFKPRHGIGVPINKPGRIEDRRPVAFTSLPESEVLELL